MVRAEAPPLQRRPIRVQSDPLPFSGTHRNDVYVNVIDHNAGLNAQSRRIRKSIFGPGPSPGAPGIDGSGLRDYISGMDKAAKMWRFHSNP